MQYGAYDTRCYMIQATDKDLSCPEILHNCSKLDLRCPKSQSQLFWHLNYIPVRLKCDPSYIYHSYDFGLLC